MITCHECGSPQYEGTLFCNECGLELQKSRERKTDVLPFSEFAYKVPPPPQETHELVSLDSPRDLTFMITSSRRRVSMELVDRIRVGRIDAPSNYFPELDLTPDYGVEKGVSRRHAVFEASNLGIALIDLGSANGTMLNGFRLPAKRPYLVKDGDEIRFADLLVHLFLE